MEYRVIIVNPEELMKIDGPFEKLLRKSTFASAILRVIFDEAHCISQWASFRGEYKDIGRIRWILGPDVVFMLASATLASLVLNDWVRRPTSLQSLL